MFQGLTRRHFLAGLAAFFAVIAGNRKTRAAAPTKTVRLQKWRCTNQDCDPYIYDPSVGDINMIDEANPIPPGVAFEDLPDDWICHVCGDPKSHFIALNEWVEVEVPA